jgi:hypothetical protein
LFTDDGEDGEGFSPQAGGGEVMLRLIFWRAMASITGSLLQVRVLLLVIMLAYVAGWIIGSFYGRGF